MFVLCWSHLLKVSQKVLSQVHVTVCGATPANLKIFIGLLYNPKWFINMKRLDGFMLSNYEQITTKIMADSTELLNLFIPDKNGCYSPAFLSDGEKKLFTMRWKRLVKSHLRSMTSKNHSAV